MQFITNDEQGSYDFPLCKKTTKKKKIFKYQCICCKDHPGSFTLFGITCFTEDNEDFKKDYIEPILSLWRNNLPNKIPR